MFNKYTKRDVWFSACICVFEVFADTWAAESNACSLPWCRYMEETSCYNIIIQVIAVAGVAVRLGHADRVHNSVNSLNMYWISILSRRGFRYKRISVPVYIVFYTTIITYIYYNIIWRLYTCVPDRYLLLYYCNRQYILF